MLKKKYLGLEIFRVLAMFSVLLIHVFSVPIRDMVILSRDWMVVAFVDFVTRWVVGGFFALSGYFLLSKIEKFDYFYKKRLTKIVIILFFWNIVYILYRLFFEQTGLFWQTLSTNFEILNLENLKSVPSQPFPDFGILSSLWQNLGVAIEITWQRNVWESLSLIASQDFSYKFSNIFNTQIFEGSYYHLYFLYVLIGLYLLSPFLQRLLAVLNHWQVILLIVIFFTRGIFTSIIYYGYKYSNGLLKIEGGQLNNSLFLSFLGFYIIGYWFRRFYLKKDSMQQVLDPTLGSLDSQLYKVSESENNSYIHKKGDAKEKEQGAVWIEKEARTGAERKSGKEVDNANKNIKKVDTKDIEAGNPIKALWSQLSQLEIKLQIKEFKLKINLFAIINSRLFIFCLFVVWQVWHFWVMLSQLQTTRAIYPDHTYYTDYFATNNIISVVLLMGIFVPRKTIEFGKGQPQSSKDKAMFTSAVYSSIRHLPKKLAPKLSSQISKITNFLSLTSFGVYLNHLLFLETTKRYLAVLKIKVSLIDCFYIFAWVLLCSIVFSYFSYLITKYGFKVITKVFAKVITKVFRPLLVKKHP